MRSRMSHTINAREVHGWAVEWLLQAKLLKDHGWLCTAAVTWNIVLRAAARAPVGPRLAGRGSLALAPRGGRRQPARGAAAVQRVRSRG